MTLPNSFTSFCNKNYFTKTKTFYNKTLPSNPVLDKFIALAALVNDQYEYFYYNTVIGNGIFFNQFKTT